MAHITRSKLSSLACVSVTLKPFELFSIFARFVLVRIEIPRSCIPWAITSHASTSNPRNTCVPRYQRWVSTPRPFRIPANSQAMYPPPTIKMRLGRASRWNISLEVIACSVPGIFGRDGQPPVANKIILAVNSRPSARRTVFGPTTVARKS